MIDASGKKLAAFLDGLVDKLFFTVITVTDELNAFKVFETLNAQGRPAIGNRPPKKLLVFGCQHSNHA